MSSDTISVDGYGINLSDLHFDNVGPGGDMPQLIEIALNRIINGEFINDDLISMIDDISGTIMTKIMALKLRLESLMVTMIMEDNMFTFLLLCRLPSRRNLAKQN